MRVGGALQANLDGNGSARRFSAAACIGVGLALASSVAAVPEDHGHAPAMLARWFTTVDDQLLGQTTGAESALDELTRRIDHACGSHRVGQEIFASCAIRVLFADGGLRPAADPADPMQNSVSHAALAGEGTCGALVATVLAATEPLGEPFEAVVFRDHVVIGLRGEKDIWFETLDHGRRGSELELGAREAPPSGKPAHVRAADFRVYYLDNLAARLAQRGDAVRAEQALRMAVAMAGKVARLRYNLGTLLLELGRQDEALEQLRMAIRYGWDDADAWVNRGAAEWQSERFGDARRSFKRALAKDPANHLARANLRAIEAEMPRARRP